MFRQLIAIALACAVALPALAQGENEIPVETRIAAAGLFKNGLAIVEETLTVRGPGVYRVDRVPKPVLGTFWVASQTPVVARMSTRRLPVADVRATGRDLQSEVAGREVEIAPRDDGRRRIRGTVVALDPPKTPVATLNPYGYVAPQPVSRYLVLRDAAGQRIYIDTSTIGMLRVIDSEETILESRPVLLLEVGGAPGEATPIAIRYLAHGLSWAPSYRVDLLSKHTLRIEQKSVLRNELTDLEDVDLSLITGYPAIPFAHVTSPFSMATSWQNYFSQLNANPQQQNNFMFMNSVVTQQRLGASSSPFSAEGYAFDSSFGEGEGADLHYQRIGKRFLAQGDTMALSVDAGITSYSRLVEWTIPDTRRSDGRPVQQHERQNRPDLYETTVWDALQFRNPLPFPLTTAPAMISEMNRFVGQSRLDWTNRKDEVTLRVTQALSVRTHHTESEEPGSREALRIAGNDFQKSIVVGSVEIQNQRAEVVNILIKRRFSGELIQAGGKPETRLREEGAWSVNPRNEIIWSFTMQPGEKKMMAYRYSVLVDI